MIQTNAAYVPNDISLGGLDKDGMLLYGINAVGKSSLMKSVGIAVIMAQAGMYVAAEAFEYAPYDHIFTRIPGGDNIFKGQSTFVAEMSELRAILKRATQRSLVIGDELCSGTESVSATSIVAAGILALASRKTSFIFATHLHEVGKLDCIRNLCNVEMYHMNVRFDEQQNIIIYDRVLKKGGGDTLYGLEVCKSLDLPPEFLHTANKIRQECIGLSREFVTAQTSRYSTSIFLDVCDICKKPAEEVHHIQEQHTADVDGFIGNMHKNARHNLVAVCQACHDAVHNKKMIIHGYVSTSQGVMLSKTEPSSEPLPEVVAGASIVDDVRTLRNAGKSVKQIIDACASKWRSKITAYRINKILKDSP